MAHVDSSAAAGGNGSIGSPFQTIAQGQSADRNIVWVAAGSTFSGANATIAMTNGEILLGDGGGLQHQINVKGFGTVTLPSARAALARVEFVDRGRHHAGPERRHFGIHHQQSGGERIYGNSVSNVAVQSVAINNAGGDGVHLLNGAGTIILSSMAINHSVGNGLVVDGGTATVDVSGTIANSQLYDAKIINTTGGTVDLTNTQFTGSGSQGIYLNNDAGPSTSTT